MPDKLPELLRHLKEQQQQYHESSGSMRPYIIAITLMTTIGIGAAVLITLIRPNSPDNTGLIVLIFGLLGTSTTGLLSYLKAQETHKAVNSRLDAWIEAATAAAAAEGQRAGRLEAEARGDLLAEQTKKGKL